MAEELRRTFPEINRIEKELGKAIKAIQSARKTYPTEIRWACCAKEIPTLIGAKLQMTVPSNFCILRNPRSCNIWRILVGRKFKQRRKRSSSMREELWLLWARLFGPKDPG